MLNITGLATLGGMLNVQLLDFGSGAFSPAAGDVFEILTAGGGIVNEFEQYRLPALAPNLEWRVHYEPNRVSLLVAGVPEPASLTLVVVSALALLAAARRGI